MLPIKAMIEAEDVQGSRKSSNIASKILYVTSDLPCTMIREFKALAPWMCFMHCCLVCLDAFVIASSNKLVPIPNCQIKLTPGQGSVVASFLGKVATIFPKHVLPVAY